MKIAHIAPLFASIPPKKYGGTERVVDWLIKEQLKLGHDVTLFASGDSVTAAHLVPIVPKGLWEEKDIRFFDAYHTIELDMLHDMASEFDIIHSHFVYIHYQSIHSIKKPVVTTLHWRVDLREFQDLYKYFNEVPLVAISESQKSYIPMANVVDVIYHGLPIDEYPFEKNPEDYFAFVGRFTPEKGAEIAITAALKAGVPIRLAAKIPLTGSDYEYFKREIEPLFKHDLVDYVGEVDDLEKQKIYKNARATLIPTNWPEPFGLVAIESLACGTPIIAIPAGGTKEILEKGESGFAVRNEKEMAAAMLKIDQIDRGKCRQYVEKNFSSSIMAKNYDKTYKKIIK